LKNLSSKLPGVTLCLFIALFAYFLGSLYPLIGGPVFAIFLGMILSNFFVGKKGFKEGISFSSKYILQTAVVLLGFGLNLSEIMKVGLTSLPIIITTITTSLLVAYFFYRFFKIDKDTAILVGVGSSICGGSAIAATAPVIEAKESDVAKSISVIFLFNILAALLFPSLGEILGLSNHGFAVFAGTAVNDTSSVTATASSWDAIHHSNTLDGATIVKLTRTLAIIPITLVLSLMKERQNGDKNFSFKRAFPSFLLYFILASLITTIFNLLDVQTSIFSHLKELSKFFIIMAMAGVGLSTNVVKLIKTGGSAIALGGLCWLAITVMDLLMQSLLGIW
jgi:Predicted membrane protein